MYTLLRNYSKFGIQPQMVLPSMKYSTAHNRIHFALKYRVETYGAQSTRLLRHSSLLPDQYYLSAGCTPTHEAYYNRNSVRYFRSSVRLYEQPSSKVEATVQSIKNKQKEKIEEIMKEAEAAAGAVDLTKKTGSEVVEKKSWKTRIWEECLHYYHGFRLLFIDIKICGQLVWRVLKGKKLTRRENNLLVRTTSDMFRLIPFSVFIIVPFLELLLPFFIKFFPGMLPSTFETAKERDAKLRQALQVRLEMAKFLQKTLDEMAVQHKDHKSEEAKQFDMFFQKIKDPNDCVSNEDIIKFAKRFEDEYTLDSLSRQQLAALCRVLELNTVGTSNLLRFQLRVKLRSLAADDRVIAREGVNSLDMWELQNACKARGMRAYGLTVEKMRNQLQEWIDLSLNERVPPTLLLLSRTIFISDDCHTTHKLKETMRALPDTLATQTKAAIGEREGKIDNKTKIEIIKEEERKIKEEREEEREEARAIAEEKVDKAPVIDPRLESPMTDPALNITDKSMVLEPVKPLILTAADQLRKAVAEQMAAKAIADEEKTLSSKDVELLSDALKTLSNDKKMMVEKETLKDLKEELEEYKEDVEELREVRDVVKEPIHESRAAQMLFKKVNSMIGQLDKVVLDLETKQKLRTEANSTEEERIKADASKYDADIVQIDELVQAIKKLKQTSDESRLKQIENVLSKLDADKDGAISVDEVLKVVEAIGRDNVKLSEKQLEELITLLDKEQIIEAEEKIEKALARSIKEAEEAKKLAEEIQNKVAAEAAATAIAAVAAAKLKSEKLVDRASVLEDKALNLDSTDAKNVPGSEASKDAALHTATEKQKDKTIPPPSPPKTSSSS